MKKTCEICGKKYEYCPNCPRDMYKPTWMHRFDSEQCKSLWDILSANGIGDISDEEALKQLEAINYQTINVQSDALKDHIAKIKNNAENSVTDDSINSSTEIESVDIGNAIEIDEEDVIGGQDDAIALEDAMNAAVEEMTEQVQPKPKKRKGFKH